MNKYLSFMILIMITNSALAQSFIGKTQWSDVVNISSYTSSSIQTIWVKEGQSIDRGGDLLKMDDTLLQFDLKIAQAHLTALIAVKTLADLDLNRAFELYDRELLSDVELKKAEFKHAQLKAEYDVAQAAKDKAEFLLNSALLKSPMKGRVLTIHKKVGFFSDNEHAVALITVVNDNAMNAVAYLKVSQWDHGLVGKKALVSMGNKVYKGVVESLSFEPIENSKGLSVYPIVVRFMPKEVIPAGMPLRIEIK